MGLAQQITHQQAMDQIDGLLYIPNYLENHEQHELVETINQQSWITDLKRRTQHYGYRYFFKTGMIYPFSYIGDFPDWLQTIAEKLHRENLFQVIPDQALVNEYLPGQGIGSHVDTIPCFGDEVISISLSGKCLMEFKNKYTKQHVAIVLEPGSLVKMTSGARYTWTHGIKKNEVECIDDVEIYRKSRIAITLRTASWKPISATRLLKVSVDPKNIFELCFDDWVWVIIKNVSKKNRLFLEAKYDCERYQLLSYELAIIQNINISDIFEYIKEFDVKDLFVVDPKRNTHLNFLSKHLCCFTAYNKQTFLDIIDDLEEFFL